MSPDLDRLADAGVRFPRVSGDEPVFAYVQGFGVWFSPRERG